MPAFYSLENGLKELDKQLGVGHSRYDEFFELRRQLERNIGQARADGSVELPNEGRQSIVSLNRLALNTTKQSFDDHGLAKPPTESIFLNYGIESCSDSRTLPFDSASGCGKQSYRRSTSSGVPRCGGNWRSGTRVNTMNSCVS
jgi:hypothetical protein